MGATTNEGTGHGSAAKVKPLIVNGSVKTANIESNAVADAKIINTALSKVPFVLNVAAITLNSEKANMPLVFTRAAGVVVTLPAATGTGHIFKFYVNTTVTSNSYKVQVANATDIISGSALTEPAGVWATTSTTDTITMNGTTQGGIKSDSLEIIDIASGQFCVKAFITQSGTAATPFSAAVS